MELALSLGEPSKSFSFLEKSSKLSRSKDLGFCMELENGDEKRVPSDPPLQLRFPWLTNDNNEYVKGLDVNRLSVTATAEESEEGAADSSPNSTLSSFQMDSGIRNGRNKGKRDLEREAERASDDDDESNESTRKKLRLSKQQSVFLEESFKEHNTLNPKQKLALSKQLNLRPRQVEVWFQNRRARTKLKQTEVDCEYLKRCCQTLTEENKRLQKELQDLRTLKTSQPFYMQHQSPATTLTMCPSCERVATASTTKASAASATAAGHTRGYPPFLSSACDPEVLSPSPPSHYMKSLGVKTEKKIIEIEL